MKATHPSLLTILLISVILVSGCTSQVSSDNQPQQVTCNKPYILVGTSCCLDQNDNSICDKDEQEETTHMQQEVTQKAAPVIKEEIDTTTLGEKNALKTAKSYLSYSSFSYDGLIHQLEYEGFTNAEAIYGADNCGADWNEQALKTAKSYLSHSSFSYSGLVHQLEYEKFTTEQAEYGVDNSGADWNEQAALTAKSYLSHSAFSREGLIHQLEYEGFTTEQAEYGVEAVGY